MNIKKWSGRKTQEHIETMKKAVNLTADKKL